MARLVIALLLGILFFPANEAGAAEEVRYQVLEIQDTFEIRRYAPFVAAETLAEGDFDSAGETGFRRLFYFIAGHNRVKHPAPAPSEPDSLMIPLTAPVFQERAAGKYRVYLPLPAEYSLQTLPEPLDSQVKLREIPARLVAAASYTGTWGQEQYSEQLARLLDWIRRSGLRIGGEPIYTRYDSSYLWFLRSNEILIPLEK